MSVDENNDAAIAPAIIAPAIIAPAIIAPAIIAPAIFRFDFAPNVVSKISEFALYQYDKNRKEYKKAWEPWCEENKEMIAEEIRRLKETGYDGDITDKMYKAGRYYFRKKSKKARKEQEQGTVEVEVEVEVVKKKRLYIMVKSETIAYIDTHIKQHINDNDFSPKTGYDKFLKTSVEIVRSESENLKRKFELSDDDIRSKIKKTYKNRYYIMTRARK